MANADGPLITAETINSVFNFLTVVALIVLVLIKISKCRNVELDKFNRSTSPSMGNQTPRHNDPSSN